MFCHSALGRKRHSHLAPGGRLGSPGARWEWQSGARSDVYVETICTEEGGRRYDPGYSTHLGGSRGPWPAGSTAGAQVCLGRDPRACGNLRDLKPEPRLGRGLIGESLERSRRGSTLDESLMDKKRHSLSFR